jgi:hypothetical protein
MNEKNWIADCFQTQLDFAVYVSFVKPSWFCYYENNTYTWIYDQKL